jgi:hypothetical protein
VEALGVGSGVRKLTVEHLTEALVVATTDAKQISRAKLIGEQIRSVRTIYAVPYFANLPVVIGGWCCQCHRIHIP